MYKWRTNKRQWQNVTLDGRRVITRKDGHGA